MAARGQNAYYAPRQPYHFHRRAAVVISPCAQLTKYVAAPTLDAPCHRQGASVELPHRDCLDAIGGCAALLRRPIAQLSSPICAPTLDAARTRSRSADNHARVRAIRGDREDTDCAGVCLCGRFDILRCCPPRRKQDHRAPKHNDQYEKEQPCQ